LSARERRVSYWAFAAALLLHIAIAILCIVDWAALLSLALTQANVPEAIPVTLVYEPPKPPPPPPPPPKPQVQPEPTPQPEPQAPITPRAPGPADDTQPPSTPPASGSDTKTGAKAEKTPQPALPQPKSPPPEPAPQQKKPALA